MYHDVISPFQKIIYRFDMLFKPKSIIINLTWYDCDISSLGSIILSQEGAGERGSVEGEMTKVGPGRDGVVLRWTFWTMFCLYSHYIYTCINITIKQIYKLYILVFQGFISYRLIPEVYKDSRFWRRVYYSEKNGVPAVTRKTAINKQYNIINIDCTRGQHGKLPPLGVTISHVPLLCSQYLYNIYIIFEGNRWPTAIAFTALVS